MMSDSFRFPTSRFSLPTFVMGLVAAVVAVSFGCAEATDDSASESGDVITGIEHLDGGDDRLADHRRERTVIVDEHNHHEVFSAQGRARFEFSQPFRQVGMQMEAEAVDALAYRVRSDGEDWSEWTPLEPRWSEGTLHNATIVVDRPVDSIELMGGEALQFAQIEFSEVVTARLHRDDLPDLIDVRDRRATDDEIATARQAVAPDSMVTSRYEWDAIDPGKICGSVVEPYRMSIHHTASPSSDGGDPAARMRGMQEYHIYNNGWCDIGYHFVVAQSGEIFQGRSRSDRPGAHVGGQNSGNVGISMIGNYNSTDPPDVQLENMAVIVGWAHEEHDIPLNRDSVKGHREWPDQWTDCPGDVGLTYIDDIIADAADGSPGAEYDVDVSVDIGGLDDFYTQGSSESVPDAFEGEEFVADIRVTNLSSEPIRDVLLEYDFDGIGVEPLNYRIESDHPEYDQESWELNDSNDAENNPPGDQMGDGGILDLFAFSPGETKRIVVDMRTTGYNIGLGDFGGVRAWMHNIRDVYGVQDAFGDAPSTNNTEQGGLLQADGRVDVLSRAEWQFRADHEGDLEGWTGEGYEEFRLNTSHELLALKTTAPGAFIDSPEWTEVDADAYDEMVIRVRSHDGDHTKRLYWSDDGELDADRSVAFEAQGDSEYQTLVLPVGDHPEWTGTVRRLRLVLVEEHPPQDFESGWYDVDYIYFQNRAEEATTSRTLGPEDGDPVELEFDGGDEGGQPGASGEHTGGDDSGSFSGTFPGVDADDDGEIETHSGCSTVGGGGLPAEGIVIAVVALVAVRFRRRRIR